MTTAVKGTQENYLRQYRELEKRAAVPAWLERLRTQGIEAFAELGFPTQRLEDRKYTNVAPLARVEFAPAAANNEAAAQAQQHPAFDLDCWRMVFINGRYAPALSRLEGLPRGVEVRSLAEALAASPAALEEHLGKHAGFQEHAFVALNSAFIEDGAFISIAKGIVLERPIHLLYVSAPGAQPAVTHPRNLIVAAQESQAAVIEAYAGGGATPSFTNAVTEIVAGENSRLDYTKLQQEGPAAFHISTIVARQGRDSNFASHSLALGSLLGREELIARLEGEGAEAHLHGLYLTTGRQLIDNHTTLDHARPHCASREFYKGVLDGASTAVFNGKIIVRPDAQKTDSKQSDKNLLLSEAATINTKPQLEIFADDVKCTHGATIGQIDPEAIFYLRSRGIGEDDARRMLVVAFGNEIIEGVRYEPLRARLQQDVLARLAAARPGRNS